MDTENVRRADRIRDALPTRLHGGTSLMKAFRIAAATTALATSIAIAPGLAQANKKHPGNQNAKPTAKNPQKSAAVVNALGRR